MRSVTSFILAAALLTGCRYEQPPPDPRKASESAAVRLLQLGYDEWAVACAWAVGRDGGTLEIANQTCRVQFDLPPIKAESHANGSN